MPLQAVLDERIAARLRLLSSLAAGLVLAAGMAVLGGYAFGVPILTKVMSGLQAMSVLTAASLILLAVSILADRYRIPVAAPAAASAALLSGCLAIASHATYGRDIINPAITPFLFHQTAGIGLISLATAGAICLIALALMFRLTGGWLAGNICASLSLLISAPAILGYVYGVQDLYALSPFRTMAVHTAISLFVLATATILGSPERGWGAVVASSLSGGGATRGQLLFTLLPPIIGWVLLRAVNAGEFGPAAAMAFLVVLTIAPLIILVIRDGRVLDALDIERQSKAAIQKHLQGDLEARLSAQASELAAKNQLDLTLSNVQIVGVWDWDLVGDRVRGDERFARLYGVDASRAADGLAAGEIIARMHPMDRARVVEEIDCSLATSAPFASEYRVEGSDGTIRHVLTRSQPRLNSAGKASGFAGVIIDMTEQRLAERALQESEIRYRQLFDSIDAGFCIIEMKFDETGRAHDYRFIEMNGAFEQQTGLKEAAGKWMRDLVPNNEQYWYDLYGDVAKTGDPVRFENLAQALDRRWYDVYAFRIGEPGTNRVALLFNDITPRRRMEAALRSREQELSLALTAARLGTWSLDLVTGKMTTSETCRRNFGRDPDAEFTYGELSDAVHPDDKERMVATVDRSIATKSDYDIEYRIVTPGGEERWLGIRGQPIYDIDGKPLRMSGVSLDITERHDTLQQLRNLNETLERRVTDRTVQLQESETRLRAIFETSYQYQGLLTPEGILLDANMASLNGIKAKLEDVAGLRFWETPWFAGTPGLADAVRAAIPIVAGGEIFSRQIHINLPENGWRWFDLTMRPLRDSEGVVTAIVPEAVEMTEQRQAEEALRQSQKMEAVGQLTGGLAHDFNNLLTGIAGSLEMLQARISQGKLQEAERFINTAQAASKRAAALTHRLLAFSRRQTLDPKPTNVNRLVAGMDDLIRRTVGPHINIEIVAAGGLWETLIDQNQLENALLNLCINARDAMPDGGRLTVETGNRWLDDRAARERDMLPGQYVSLCVSDTGTGMTPEVIARAFDPFFTTKPIGLGTGLGLSMIYGFARQSGGQARIYSEIGQGSMVCLYLPRHPGAEAEDETAPGTNEILRARLNETVLVVDDEPSIRMLIAEVLGDLGYTAIEAIDGAGGMKIIQSDVRLDLLITDVGLPGGMNGRQVADAAREARPDLKVLFITGYAENAVVGNGHLDPGMSVLTKPFAMEALGNKIREIIGS